jgi:hypothetical protein
MVIKEVLVPTKEGMMNNQMKEEWMDEQMNKEQMNEERTVVNRSALPAFIMAVAIGMVY